MSMYHTIRSLLYGWVTGMHVSQTIISGMYVHIVINNMHLNMVMEN